MRKTVILTLLLALVGFACSEETGSVNPSNGGDVEFEYAENEQSEEVECTEHRSPAPLCGSSCTDPCGCDTCTPGEGYCGDDPQQRFVCATSGDCYEYHPCPYGTVCSEENGTATCVALSDGDEETVEQEVNETNETFENEEATEEHETEAEQEVSTTEEESVQELEEEHEFEQEVEPEPEPELEPEPEVLPTGEVIGCVRYFNRTNHSGITVYLEGSNGTRIAETETDSDCSFELTEVPVGIYILHAQAEGYQSKQRSNVMVLENSVYDAGELVLRYSVPLFVGDVYPSIRFSPSRTYIVFAADVQGDYGRLLAVPADANSQQVQELATDAYYTNYNFLRDNSGLLYLYPYDRQMHTASVWLAHFDNTPPQQLLADIYFSYTYDITSNRLIYYKNYNPNDGTWDIYYYSLDNNTSQLLGQNAAIGFFLLSGLGGVVYLEPTVPTIHKANLHFSLFDGSDQLVDSEVYQFTVAFHPDGRHIAYYKIDDTEQIGNLTAVNLTAISNGSTTLAQDVFTHYVRFANDGSYVFYWRNTTSFLADLYSLPINANLEPTEAENLLVRSFFKNLHKFLDEDNSVLTFVYDDENGLYNLVEVSFDGTTSRMLYQGCTAGMLRTANSNRYVFVQLEGNGGYNATVMRIDRNTNEITTAAEDVYAAYLTISSDGDKIYFFRNFDPSTGCGDWYVRSITTGEETLLGLRVHFSFEFFDGTNKALFVAGVQDGYGVLKFYNANTNTLTTVITNIAPGDYRRFDSNRVVVKKSGKLYLAYLDGAQPTLIFEKAPQNFSAVLLDAAFNRLFVATSDTGLPQDLPPGLYKIVVPAEELK